MINTYRITDVENKKGDLIENKYKKDEWFIKNILIGNTALLVSKDSERCLKTSEVEDVSIWENCIRVMTRNSIYYLTPATNRTIDAEEYLQ